MNHAGLRDVLMGLTETIEIEMCFGLTKSQCVAIAEPEIDMIQITMCCAHWAALVSKGFLHMFAMMGESESESDISFVGLHDIRVEVGYR